MSEHADEESRTDPPVRAGAAVDVGDVSGIAADVVRGILRAEPVGRLAAKPAAAEDRTGPAMSIAANHAAAPAPPLADLASPSAAAFEPVTGSMSDVAGTLIDDLAGNFTGTLIGDVVGDSATTGRGAPSNRLTAERPVGPAGSASSPVTEPSTAQPAEPAQAAQPAQRTQAQLPAIDATALASGPAGTGALALLLATVLDGLDRGGFALTRSADEEQGAG